MSKDKKLKYSAIRQNDTLDIAVALSQASSLLDQVAKKAIKEDNSYLLLQVADKWIEIAKLFGSDEEEIEEHLDTDSGQYGFCIDKKEEEVNDEDE